MRRRCRISIRVRTGATACAAMAVLAVLLGAPAAADVVVRRGAEGELVGDIGVTDAGVQVRSEMGAAQLVTWDRVRDVRMERPPPDLDVFLGRAERLWRARTRLERGDAALAEPLFAALAETYAGQTHETALVVMEGLLRCRIARGANAEAVIPALEVARLRRAGLAVLSYAALPQVMDESNTICTAVPPAWIDRRAAVRLQRDLAQYDARGDAAVQRVARLYLTALNRHLGVRGDETQADAVTTARPDAPLAVAILPRLVRAAAANADDRAEARASIEGAIDAWPRWAQAWGRYALGRSYLHENDLTARQAGLVQLLHVPARHAPQQPFLAGLALHQAAAVLASTGDDDGAVALRRDLLRRFPGHPVHAPDRMLLAAPVPSHSGLGDDADGTHDDDADADVDHHDEDRDQPVKGDRT